VINVRRYTVTGTGVGKLRKQESSGTMTIRQDTWYGEPQAIPRGKSNGEKFNEKRR
jgi:hypothetical protein